MAASTSFKQQCPSCEAMVPIRDPKLIGRKIDCPKCKYRFVVEAPEEEAEETAPAKGVKNGKPAKAEKPEAAKAEADKGGPKKKDEADDKDKKKAPAAAGGNSKMLIMGGGLIAVAVLAVVVCFAMWPASKPKPAAPG